MTARAGRMALSGLALLAAVATACTAGEACDDKHACDKGFVCSANLCVPTVAFTADGQTVSEAVGVVTVSVSLSAKSKHEVTVPFTVSGTATNPADYNIANGTFSIVAGQTGASITFTVDDDALYEPAETVILTLGTATNALASGIVHVVTITDNDAIPTVAFAAASQTVAESAGSVTVAVNLSAAAGVDVSVPYTVSGTAANPADHNLANGTINIPAGQTTANISFTVVDDAIDENDETIVVTLATPTNATLGTTTVHTVTVLYSDRTVAFSAASQSVSESVGTVTVTVSLSAAIGLTVTVPYTVSGTATNHNLANGTFTIPAGQTSANVTFSVVDNAVDDADNTAILSLGAPTNATLGATTVYTVTILDNDPTPTVAFSTASQTVAESVGTMTVTASLSAASGRDVTIPYAVSGTATNPADHDLTNGTITIAAGQTSANVAFSVVDDALDENDETVILTLGTPTNAILGGATVRTVTITDNDPQPTVAFALASQSFAESVGSVTVIASLSAVSGLTVTVPYTVSGTATNPADHNLANGTITIPAGSTSANVPFTVIDDALCEGNETVVVTLGTPTNATLGATTVHTVTITDNDPTPTVAFTAASQSVAESVGTVTITAGLSAASGQTVTVPYTVFGTATNPADHNLASGTLTINAGSTSANITFTVVDDALDENDETVILTLGTPTNATLGSTTTHTVTIASDIRAISAGCSHTCALLWTGKVRCWGNAYYGQLGYGNGNNIGNYELPSSAGDVSVGGDAGVIQIAAGCYHTCALLSTGKVRCWGQATYGQIGYGNTDNIGDNELPSTAGDVSVGGDAGVIQIAVGSAHTCALLSTGKVRCWGYCGGFGYGNTNWIGDNELPSTAGDVSVGGDVTQLAAGYMHTCALLSTGKVRCWGYNPFGQLGYGNVNTIGDDELPLAAGDVSVDPDAGVIQIAAGQYFTCALLSTGKMRCWGYSDHGQLGYGNKNTLSSPGGDVTVVFNGADAGIIHFAAGSAHVCALLSTSKVRCWGLNRYGQLGYGNANDVGDDAGEFPSTAGDVYVGPDASVIQLAAGQLHTCALLSTGAARCWGRNGSGELGYGHTNDIGDDAGEYPSTAGDVQVQ